MLAPVAEDMYTLLTVIEFAPAGMGPATIPNLRPIELHIVEEMVKGVKPVLVKVTLELGLKMPMLYNITATITIIKMAQP